MSFFWPGDERMVGAAVAEARAAGVAEPVIEGVVGEEAALGDSFSAPFIVGRLGALARGLGTRSAGWEQFGEVPHQDRPYHAS